MNSKNKSLLIFLFFMYFPFCFIFSQGWTSLNTSGSISPRTNASAIYVPSQNKMFVFGGALSVGTTNELWSLDFNSNSWTLIPSKSTQLPPARYTHICMYDSLMNRILVWSGQGASLYNDVWAFNFSDSTWQVLFPDGNVTGAPLKRYGTATIFDPKNKNIINFAGFTTSGRFDDTWSFDVNGQNWTDRSNSYFPLKRCLTSSAFAADRREMIVFGGQSTGNLNDIWKLNVDTYNWTNITPTVNPGGRHFASNTYCGNGTVVIFGGNSLSQGNNSGALNDLWKFSLNTQKWDTLPQIGSKPLPRFDHTSIYIPSQDKLVIFGGQGISSLFSDTWIYNGIYSLINGISENDNQPLDLTCYPNPTNSILYIEMSRNNFEITSAYVTDALGRIVINVALAEQNNSIDISFLNNGIYNLVIESGTKKLSKRFIKTE